jgi:hypothetical protein
VSEPDPDVYKTIPGLLSLTTRELLSELIDTATNLANLSSQIGFLRAEEIRGVSFAKEERAQLEGTRAAYDEKKWVCIRLLDVLK